MGRNAYVFGCSHDVPPKTPEGKRGFSRIILPSLIEGTISNAEGSSAGASPPWLGFNFCFFETKIKEKVFRAADDIFQAKIFIYQYIGRLHFSKN